MNLFEAMEWMAKNPGKELNVDYNLSDNGSGIHLRVRVQADKFECCMNRGGWVEWSPILSRHNAYSADVPERKLPELPEGDRWDTSGANPILVTPTCVTYFCIGQEDACYFRKQAARFFALVEEYETRPK